MVDRLLLKVQWRLAGSLGSGVVMVLTLHEFLGTGLVFIAAAGRT